MEEWRPVQEFMGHYVSSEGRLRRRSSCGYVYLEIHETKGKPWVYISGYKRSLAPIVMKAFGEERGSEFAIEYKDGDPRNCRADNLYWVQRTSNLAAAPVGKGAVDDQSIIDLWTAMLDLAIRDLWYGQNPRSGADRMNANEARLFFQKAYWFYLGEDPDPTTMKAIARRVKEFDDNRYKGGRVRLQKEMPEMSVSLGGSRQQERKEDHHFGGTHFLRLHACDWEKETLPFD